MFKIKTFMYAVFATLVALSIIAPAFAGQMEETTILVPEPFVSIESSENCVDISIEQS